MRHPSMGERVYVRPTNPAVAVQRGEGLFGQVLPAGGQEVLWDDFLHRRLAEGAITWSPIAVATDAPSAAGAELPAAVPIAAPEKEPG